MSTIETSSAGGESSATGGRATGPEADRKSASPPAVRQGAPDQGPGGKAESRPGGPFFPAPQERPAVDECGGGMYPLRAKL